LSYVNFIIIDIENNNMKKIKGVKAELEAIRAIRRNFEQRVFNFSEMVRLSL